MVWVSMPLRESTTTVPNVSNGYGPSRFSSHAIASGVTSSASAVSGSDRGVQ